MSAPPTENVSPEALALFKALDGKLEQSGIDALTAVLESLHSKAVKANAEMNRLKADNRHLRALLAESRRVLRAASEDYKSESFLGRLFGV